MLKYRNFVICNISVSILRGFYKGSKSYASQITNVSFYIQQNSNYPD